ncbi:hypothetical protein Pcinc_040208 [Petrolisthes cinctipes]|uniref:Uncharacterized protein n=1 Tax=Petrolisthes cinctipes TaxID=88211 RepID=A0AAE1BMD5_PETCI|nr:hypothetical protein Pcinc_040208 [Petrolisthes cinctipes]
MRSSFAWAGDPLLNSAPSAPSHTHIARQTTSATTPALSPLSPSSLLHLLLLLPCPHPSSITRNLFVTLKSVGKTQLRHGTNKVSS